MKKAWKSLLVRLTYVFKKRWIRKPLIAAVSCFLLFLLLNFLFPLQISNDYSQIITAKDGRVLNAYLNKEDKWRMYTELDEITPELSKAIVYKEDKYFYRHWGVNPIAIIRAAWNNTVKGRRTSGASTITMQVARMLYPAERTYWSKIKEIFRALQLEWKYSKKEILQLYLNRVPYGSNIEGVKSASLLYFGKLPNVLSLAEITTLAIIPNRPTSLRLGENNSFIVQERNQWLQRFKTDELFNDTVINDAINEPLTAQRLEAPNVAPHLGLHLKSAYADKNIIKTAIQYNYQLQVQQITKNYVERVKSYSIHNAAVLVVDNETRKIMCYVGSADFYNPEDGGQVDGVQAVRSPGSALKPFLYAKAFEMGFITPKSVINDVPVNFTGYEPENYDKNFNGKVTAEKALAMSLNIPAVKLLHQMEVPYFANELAKINFSTIKKQQKKLGLSMILGGCGVSLEEMTALYSALANYGVYSALYFLQEDSARLKVPAVSPEAAYLVTSVLTQIQRPDLPNNFQNSLHLPKIAWKTGTSYGRRDAWSIGYNRRYTIGVWVGNFSGVGVPELSGANVATPLLFELFNTLDYNAPRHWFSPPPKLDMRNVCSESGDLPADYCQSIVQDYYLPGLSRTVVCNHKKQVAVNKDSTLSYCTQCQPADGYVLKLYDNIEPELATYYESKKINYQKIPPHNPTCSRVFRQNAPSIVSPVDGSEYLIEKNDPQKLMLSCHTPTDVKWVYWYVNDVMIKKSPAQQPVFIEPAEGKLKISCADDKGRNSNVWVKVEFY